MTDQPSKDELLLLTAQIISSHARNNTININDIPAAIHEIYKALAAVGGMPHRKEHLQPAVSIKKSVTPEYIICLEDGKKLKMLKRHLKTAYNMTPEEYRERWNLPPEYPMVAPEYAKHRSKLAREIGLGKKDNRKKKKV
ncbi:MAG: MucR family transcriptional regulator [Alphaproteobacteria bacterium]|nr:MucR family transcriptional regulator [Alphaproteobacteria bacterium]